MVSEGQLAAGGAVGLELSWERDTAMKARAPQVRRMKGYEVHLFVSGPEKGGLQQFDGSFSNTQNKKEKIERKCKRKKRVS